MATETITQASELTFTSLPPFPSTIPTAPLHRLSLQKLRADPEESARLFSSSKDLGFFYLDLRGDKEGESLLQDADELFTLAPKLYDLGREELSKYDYKSKGSYMGYKGFGSAVVDEKGNLDRNEFYNIPKDDFLGISSTPFDHPRILYDHKELIVSYMNTSHSLVTLILQHLTQHLHLPPDTLTSLHRKSRLSGDQVRFVKSPPQPPSDQRTALGKHTDFGSITILFNRLGGLQILPPPSLTPPGQEPQWTYVKPLPGHCIVNLGDAMVKFTNGLLRSNIHRVVSPPGEQAKETRYSLVYFARPEEDIILRRLEGSDVIPELEGEEEAMSSKEWIKLQAMRLRNVKPEMTDEERKKLWEETGRGK
ncbi:hypothetical protein BKA64DRAFT_679158 [Cadophora sp. MPI-SDFR-AT-0126]|nr:hypothetical protein BKA64DRAFT_679158 [Leotiomycetes sp. MPI-SDFR-AT-0126]